MLNGAAVEAKGNQCRSLIAGQAVITAVFGGKQIQLLVGCGQTQPAAGFAGAVVGFIFIPKELESIERLKNGS